MRRFKSSSSSSPPEFLPSSIENDNVYAADDSYPNEGERSQGSESMSSRSPSSSTMISTTPPSSISRKVRQSSDEISSRSSSLSASPTTPKKEWELRFKSYQKLRKKERMDNSPTEFNNNLSKVALPDIGKHTSKSLPRNYTLPSQVQQGVKLVAPKHHLKMKRLERRNQDIKMSKSLDESIKDGKFHSIDINDDYLSGDSDYSLTSSEGMIDRSTRGGNVFGSLFKKKSKDKKSPTRLEENRRAKSCDDLMDRSIRGGSGEIEVRGSRVRTVSDDGKKFVAGYSTKYGPIGSVIGPDGVLRNISTKVDDRKEKKLMFTEVRNSANSKDSATAYLGDEKSVHKGKNFDPVELESLTLSDRSLTTVTEESDNKDLPSVILSSVDGVDSWSEQSKNLIFPAIVAMCRTNVFEMFDSSNSQGDNNETRFGSIPLGTLEVAREYADNMKDEDFKWKQGYFELRQNYLIEYDASRSTMRPRGYAFLQDANIKPYLEFKNALRLEYIQHQGKRTRCAVIIKLKSGTEVQRLSTSLQKATTMKIEDLYEYDSSEGGLELGKGRYATIRPGRRRRHLTKTYSGLHSSLANAIQEDNGDAASFGGGILKKKPSFSSFPNLNVLSQEDYECALKIVDKKLFWKTVERGNERADSIVRETCVQATLITQARDHKGFLRLKSYFETRDKVVLELELLEGTDLYQYIKKKQPLSELEASNIMYDILSCVVVMKNLGIAHRDLKPANILMANKSNRYGMRVNVGDFGNATFVGADNLVRGRCGTVGYVAPEIFLAQKNSGYENKVDEFSAGVILYVLLCGYEPFYGETEKKLIKENTKAKVEFPEEDWQSISVEGRDLVEKLLKRDPAERIDASKALQHAWITRRALRKRQSVSQDDGHDHDRFQPENYACSIS